MTLFAEPVHTVYRTTCLVNGKFYIGYHKTKDTEDSYLGSGQYLRVSVKKHGRENFKKETLFIFKTRMEAMNKEFETVETYFKKDPLCMNLRQGGIGYEPTEHSKQGQRGKQSQETCDKKSKAHRGKKQSQETIAKRMGRKHSDIAKLKIGLGHKGKKVSEVARSKQSISGKNRPKMSRETCKKISESSKGKIVSDETKLLLSTAAKLDWAKRKAKKRMEQFQVEKVS